LEVPELVRPVIPASTKTWAICCCVVSRLVPATMVKSASSAVNVTVRVTEVATPSVSWAKAAMAENRSRLTSLIPPIVARMIFFGCHSEAGHADTDALAQEVRAFLGGQCEQAADQVALGQITLFLESFQPGLSAYE